MGTAHRAIAGDAERDIIAGGGSHPGFADQLGRSFVWSGRHATQVFTCTGKPVPKSLAPSASRRGQRGGPSDLLGHKLSWITTHYSAAELTHMWAAADNQCVTPATVPQ